jgi:choline-glycine betaine transporter
MKSFFKQILQDKNNSFSLREVTIAILLLIIIISWVAHQFFGKNMPEFMFYSFISLIAAGCFGYSIEKKSFNQPNDN